MGERAAEATSWDESIVQSRPAVLRLEGPAATAVRGRAIRGFVILAVTAVLIGSPMVAASEQQGVVSNPQDASEPETDDSPRDNRLASGLGLTGAYVVLGAWMWVAWYKDQPTLPAWRFGGDGWFGKKTYAGGADKLGHLWTNLVLVRLGTQILQSGGWSNWSSSLFAAGLSLAAFLLIEVNDGFYTEFSPGDLTANAIGVLMAVVMSNWPELDAAIDFRVQWFPSADFLAHPSADFAEDYSGQTYLLAYKLCSIAAVRRAEGPLSWLQFINPVIGFESRNYKPLPVPGGTSSRRQSLFVGVTIDFQAVIDLSINPRTSNLALWSRRVGHGVFEFANAPFTTFPLLQMSRTAPPVGP